jgi:uroporphyrinogen decarboxylase
MNDSDWNTIMAVIRGEEVRPLPVAFLIDGSWLSTWTGMTLLDYYASEELWFEANRRAVCEFPDCIFLPGFWSEFGMCTEPSAFGTKCTFPDNDFPFAQKIIYTLDDIDRIKKPDPRQDGLLPFVIHRLRHYRPKIEEMGHQIRFAISRGPLNIVSFLMGITEFMTELRANADKMHYLLRLVTDFIGDWLDYQRECFPSISGVLLLDDIVGFIGEADYKEFVMPYLKDLFTRTGFDVRFFHNDAPCRSSAPHLHQTGINLYNMGIEASLKDIQTWTGGQVTLMGNIPPRDVLAAGSVKDVEDAVEQQFDSLPDTRRVLFSCGGGVPPGVPTENIRAFISKVKELRRPLAATKRE